jgi:hypothetical protein
MVDGVRIPAVTHWFYGISDLLPKDLVVLDRTKAFRAADIRCLEQVGALARAFIGSVSALPFVSTKELSRESKKFEQTFAKARCRAKECSPLYVAFLCLAERLPPGVADRIVAFN